MNNFRFLNFNNILNKKIYDEPPPRVFCGYKIVENASQYLTEEALDIFSKLKMEPYVCILFQTKKKITDEVARRHKDDALLHSDIYFEDGQWKDWQYGINLELYPATSQFYWWDTKNANKIYPDISSSKIPEFFYLNGIHYYSHYNQIRDRSNEFKVLEMAEIDGTKPILVRTDIAHSISYTSKSHRRAAVSLRFKQNRFSSWQEAYETIKI